MKLTIYFQNKHSISEWWDNIKRLNIPVNEVPEKTGGEETIFEETMTEKCPMVTNMINPPIQGGK